MKIYKIYIAILSLCILVFISFAGLFTYKSYLSSGDVHLINLAGSQRIVEESIIIVGILWSLTVITLITLGCVVFFQMRKSQMIIEDSTLQLRKLSRAVEQSPVSVIMTNVHGDIEYVNPKFTTITGYTSEEILGKNPRILKSGYTTPAEYRQLWKCITNGGEWRGELHNRKKNGELYWESASISAIRDLKGEIVNFLAVKEDITERKQSEAELKAALDRAATAQKQLGGNLEKLKIMANESTEAKNIALAANKTKSEFLANMSHELRTPLNAIIGFSELMVSGLVGDLSDKQQEYTNDITKSGYHLLKLINDILDLSKIEAGKVKVEPESTSICSIFENCIAMIGERAQEKQINVEVKTSCDGLFVYADPLRVKQIILNLLSNSVKFTREGGKIDISCMVGDDIVITIEDNGIGMDEEGVKAALTKFGQVNTGIAREYAGTGLGLPLSVELAVLMNGNIDVASKLGIGTTVTLTLPKAPKTL